MANNPIIARYHGVSTLEDRDNGMFSPASRQTLQHSSLLKRVPAVGARKVSQTFIKCSVLTH